MSEKNVSRCILEDSIVRLAQLMGVHVCWYDESRRSDDLFENLRLIRNVPFKNIWEYDGRSEFVLECRSPSRSIRIECKYQDTSGSTDDKVVKTVFELQQLIPEDESLLVIDGVGWDRRKLSAVRKWGETFKFGPKSMRAMSLREYESWFRQFVREYGERRRA